MRKIDVFRPGDFRPENHFYPRVLNAQIHPIVSYFLKMSRDRLVNRFCHLNPRVDEKVVYDLLNYSPKYFPWAGGDLFSVTTEKGNRKMVVIETNSSPSGQKSMPTLDEIDQFGRYYELIKETFLPILKNKKSLEGVLCVLYDKNKMEASGYAATIAELTGENVFLVPCYTDDEEPFFRFNDGVLEIRHPQEGWIQSRAAFRYVTQKPWNRIPLHTKTYIFNPVLACLAGGRNKMLAAKAYDFFNSEMEGSGVKINTPETTVS